ncbi:protein SENESCENCE-ASSOCIATED GENE 21, mitochondrial-like [Cajanus cajan]|uniref:protein SENESCENCE-ASSOCIATED GENE 21, mitochondrial-like n=1 Tax=Cajanus cajan TaxID=3821 RepID=UPI00098DBA58|nr:protein SENESCENCE-ASSOCIATED GENE 21, mitochondrial-like [Cajanus cajan]
MANILVNRSFLLRKRCYGSVAESIRSHVGSTTVKAKSASENGNGNDKKEIFWMRDPKSGNWIPENHFGEVDAAELRDKFLPRRT